MDYNESLESFAFNDVRYNDYAQLFFRNKNI